MTAAEFKVGKATIGRKINNAGCKTYANEGKLKGRMESEIKENVYKLWGMSLVYSV